MARLAWRCGYVMIEVGVGSHRLARLKVEK